MVSGKTSNETLLVERHAHLVASTTELLLQKGFHETSVREFADAAGWNIGTLYRYIKQKEDVLFLVFDDFNQQVHRVLREHDEGDTAYARLCGIIERYYTFVANRRREYRLLYREAASLLPEHQALMRRREEEELDLIAEVIELGMNNGEFKPVNAKLFAVNILMLGQMWALKGRLLYEEITPKAYVDHQLEWIMRELRSVQR
jgi:AcrR family transcriptional regulator